MFIPGLDIGGEVERQFQEAVDSVRGFGSAGVEDEGEDVMRATEEVAPVKVADDEIVHPGDLITAEFMNKLLLRLAKLEAIIGFGGASERGTFSMKNLFGASLLEAIKSIRKSRLRLVRLVTVEGEVITAQTLAKAGVLAQIEEITRKQPVRVLGQYPVPDARARRGAKVYLLISPLPLRLKTVSIDDGEVSVDEDTAGTMGGLLSGALDHLEDDALSPQPGQVEGVIMSRDAAATTGGTKSAGTTTKTTKRRATKKNSVVKKDDTKTDAPA